MPIYLHTCKICGYEQEEYYSIEECNDDPSNKWNNLLCPICIESFIDETEKFLLSETEESIMIDKIMNEKNFLELILNKQLIEKIKLKRTLGNVEIGKFNSKNIQERKIMLKKRSREHFKKELKDKFYQMNDPKFIP